MKPPEAYAETPEGLLLMADGLSAMRRWDGISTSTYPVGVTAPATAATLSSSGAGALTGTYFVYVRFVNERGAVSDLSPIATVHTATDKAQFDFTNVPVSTQANVVRRQLLRNTDGQAQTFYVDVDTTDLVATSFTSTKTDDQLAAGTAVPFIDENGDPLANTHGLPPAHKCALAHHSGRMFAAVDQNYSRGGVAVASASASVRGVNTDWTTSLEGRFLWVKGAAASYEIDSVDVANQVLTLTAAYASATDLFAQYTIRPAPAERRLIYYTQAAEPESWPAFNAVSLQEDGDEITGLMQKASFIYVLERKHVYRYTFQSNPNRDGFVYLSATRGCVNNRCWVIADGVAYMLDYAGVHAFSGGEDTQSVSDDVMALFRSDRGEARVNWQAEALFHAAHSPDEATVRWFVCLSGEYAPRHALAYHYRWKRWWIEEYDRPVTSSATGTFESRRRCFLGGEGGRAYLLGQGNLDRLGADDGQTRGLVSAADLYGLTDADAQWPPSLEGRSVTIVSGTGQGQRRTIIGASSTRLRLLTPWLVMPDATSTYQLGGIGWEWRSGWFRYARLEEQNSRKVEVLYEPTAEAASLVLRTYRDFSDTPVVWRGTHKGRDAGGFAAAAGSADLVADMSVASGYAHQRLEGHKELYVQGARYVSVGLSGVTGRDDQALYQVGLDGVEGGQD